MSYSVKYPRRVLIRNTFRYLARELFPLLSSANITGLENFPKRGPLILVGNHTGAMEVVMMAAYAPRTIEFMGAMEMPWNGWMGKIIDMYGLIPVFRGYTSPQTMRMGIDIIKQEGLLGVFPEGGFWEPGKQKPQTGAAWLSYKAQAPVLPIGFGDTRGKMAGLFRFERPVLEMNVGKVLPPFQLNGELSKKEALQQAADQIMDAVWDLVPEDEKRRKENHPENEVFSLKIEIFDRAGQPIPIPADLAITDGSWISRFAHRPNLIDSIRDYIFIPVQVLKELDRKPAPEEIYAAADSMLEYVEQENPQYFNYRYGYQDGAAFHTSFRQLRALMGWVIDHQYRVEAVVRYEYVDPQTRRRCVLTIPEELDQW